MSARVLKYSLVLALAAASVAGAQAKSAAGPAVATKGTTKANEHAAKGQATAMAARTDARLNKAERNEVDRANADSRAVLKGIKLSKAERTTVNGIVKKYDAQRKELAKTEATARKAGTPDAEFASKLNALRDQERSELRAALTATEQAQFDKNVAKRDLKKG